MNSICYTNKWRLAFCLALFFICNFLSAQQAYFQQEVNYKMEVRLDDEAHTLSAKQEIQYINNSAQAIDFIYFHLWPNAYKNQSTALAKQFLQHNKTDLYFSKPEERGFIDSLDFKVNGQAILWEYDKDNIDICKLFLNSPLKSLDTLIITTPFFVKIPDAKFSRLGHDKQAYFITQWYPKPAVFDKEGWHPMPYLDQGEFYSEFGSFDVKITLPKNYVLSATGDRIDADEEETFLNNKVIETIKHIDNNTRNEMGMAFPPSSKELKTIEFRQYRVHDFAWFADKRFYALHDQIELPATKHTVDTWTFFTNKNFDKWKKSIDYVNESTRFYSYLLGDYPYNHVTAVDGTIMAGGGMEYPNITVIGDVSSAMDLDVVITHEVGHNWFYGILANNERDNPALDEGINSFYEMRYVRAKYPYKKLSDYMGRDSSFNFFGLNKTPFWKEKEMAFFMSLKSHTDQAIDLSAEEFTPFNYGSIIYSKTPVVFDYLLDYMGEEAFDDAMRFYFEQYKFKHPKPKDILQTMSFFSGRDLSNFEKYFFTSTDHIDYKIKHLKRNADNTFTLQLKNNTKVLSPVNIYGFKDNKPVGAIWFDGFENKKEITFPAADVDYFKIDGLDRMPDINRKNNWIRTHGLFKKAKPLQLNLISKFENPAKTQINYLPIGGINFYNGFMIGAGIHNYGFYQKRFEYLIAPMYAFKTKTPVGFAEFNLNLYPKKNFQQITIGAKAKSFTYDYFNPKTINDTLGTNYKNLYSDFYKIAPYIQFELKKKTPTSNIHQLITYSNTNLFTDSLHVTENKTERATIYEVKNSYSFINQLSYNLTNKRAIDPFKLNVNVQHTARMAKLSATLNYQITVSKHKTIELRIFAGTFMFGSEADKGHYAFRASGYTGSQDYAFESNYVARNETNGFGFSQFTEKDGALKVWTPLGQSSQWLSSVNIKSPKIFKLPVKVFADAVVCDGRYLNKEKFMWDAGINIILLKDIVDVYLPLAYNKDVRQVLELNNIGFFNRIRFTLNIHKLVPKDFIKNNLF